MITTLDTLLILFLFPYDGVLVKWSAFKKYSASETSFHCKRSMFYSSSIYHKLRRERERERVEMYIILCTHRYKVNQTNIVLENIDFYE